MQKALVALVAFGTYASSGCGGGGGMSQATPQETATGYQQAVADEDWERAFAYMTRKAQSDMVGLALMTGGYGGQTSLSRAESFAELVNKHGLRNIKNEELRELDNLLEIFVELVAWIEDSLPSGYGGAQFKGGAKQMADTEFTDFEIEGDRATAKMVRPRGTTSVRFRLIGGRWFVD